MFKACGVPLYIFHTVIVLHWRWGMELGDATMKRNVRIPQGRFLLGLMFSLGWLLTLRVCHFAWNAKCFRHSLECMCFTLSIHQNIIPSLRQFAKKKVFFPSLDWQTLWPYDNSWDLWCFVLPPKLGIGNDGDVLVTKDGIFRNMS